MKTNCFQINDGVLLSVFRQAFKILKNNNKAISDRILLAFGINPANEFDKIDFDLFISFYKILIFKDAPITSMIDFVEKVILYNFFSFLNNSFSKQIKKKIKLN